MKQGQYFQKQRKNDMSLAEQFEAETGTPAINSQGEPDIDYVAWLEAKVKAQKLEPEVSEVENARNEGYAQGWQEGAGYVASMR